MWKHIKLLKKLGEGGMGEVWLAYDADRAAQYAVKKLHPHLLRDKDITRFQREIEHLSLLSHPNIVRIVDFSVDPSNFGYAMEYCPFGSIESVIAETRGNANAALKIFWEVAAGLKHAHNFASKILHRDIKPANILIGADGQARLSDFGLSVMVESDSPRVTSSNWISPGFSPPEQYDDFRNVDERGDIYALGASLYYLLTGNIFTSDGLESFDDPIKQLLELLLARDRKDRLGNVEAVEEFWRKANSNDEIEKYSTLRKLEKLERLREVSNVYCGTNDDFGKINHASWFLKEIEKIESDEDIMREIVFMRARIHKEGIAMEIEMELENPSH